MNNILYRPYELYNPDYVPSGIIELKSAIQQKESETINDFCWYPMTNLSSKTSNKTDLQVM